jgi:glycine C-acetyltransferase
MSQRARACVFSLVTIIFVVHHLFSAGKARIRVQISAAHSTEDIDRAVDAFIRVRSRLQK